MELFHSFCEENFINQLSMDEIDENGVDLFQDHLIFEYNGDWDMKSIVFDTDKNTATFKHENKPFWQA